MKKLFIREESHLHEYRTPLVPKDVSTLLYAGFEVIVQKSHERIYSDMEYQHAGATITSDTWYHYSDSLILGIKEIVHLDRLHEHVHVYFSHSFKGQHDSMKILHAFIESKSQLYDYEYFTDDEGKRLIAFGWYAGAVGAVLGIQQWRLSMENKNLGPLKPFASYADMLASIQSPCHAKIALVGAHGRCGTGVRAVLDQLGISYTVVEKEDANDSLANYDIIYNCILLHESYQTVWISQTCKPDHHVTIVDISCDYSKPNNPLPLYTEATTWSTPVICPSPEFSIVAIENLPSLLPKESSDHFSGILTSLILGEHADTWKRAEQAFVNAVHNSLLANTHPSE